MFNAAGKTGWFPLGLSLSVRTRSDNLSHLLPSFTVARFQPIPSLSSAEAEPLRKEAFGTKYQIHLH